MLCNASGAFFGCYKIRNWVFEPCSQLIMTINQPYFESYLGTLVILKRRAVNPTLTIHTRSLK